MAPPPASASLPSEVTPRFVAEIYPHPSVSIATYPAIAAALQAFVDRAVAVDSKALPGGYIWQREPLRFGVQGCAATVAQHGANARHQGASQHASSSKSPPRIVASMRHGGSVEDEWLAVHLLMLVTQEQAFSAAALSSWADGDTSAPTDTPRPFLDAPGLVVSVADEDGQFVLIEASEVLLSWMQPANAEGRLWLAQGKFHIIDPATHRGDQDAATADQGTFEDVYPLRVESALSVLWQKSPASLRAPDDFHAAIIAQRLTSFPSLEWAQDTQHTTLAFLPTRAAYMLHRCPQLVADAAEAFEARDGPKDARVLRDMTFFANDEVRNFALNASTDSISSSSPSVLLVQVRLPRRLYATLLAEKYFPPKSLGSAWRSAVADYWDILETEAKELSASQGQEHVSSVEVRERQTKRDQGRRMDLGCKIVCGLELAYANMKERQSNAPRNLFATEDSSADIRQTHAYSRFVASLTALGFFYGSMPDSQAWKEREAQAVEVWKGIRVQSKEDDDADDTSIDDDRVRCLLDAKDDTTVRAHLPPHHDVSQGPKALSLLEEPDSFLYDTLTDQQAASDSKGRAEIDDDDDTRAEKAAEEQLNAFSAKLHGFVEGEGDIYGALFEDEVMTGEDSADDGQDDGEGAILSARERLAKMSAEERQRVFEGIVPKLRDEEWGAKASLSAKDQGVGSPSLPEGATALQEYSAAPRLSVEEIETVAVRRERRNHAPASTSPNTRLKGFSRRVRYDGASDSEESIDDEVLRAGDTEEDRQNRARHLGLERELAEQSRWRQQAEEDGDLPASANDDDAAADLDGLPMGTSDLENFLDFARKELGLSQEQYDALLDDRRRRGAAVPDLGGRSDARASATHEQMDANVKNPQTDERVREVSFANEPQPTSAASVAADAAIFGSDLVEEDEDEGQQSFPGVSEYGVTPSRKPAAVHRDAKQTKSLNNGRTTQEEKQQARLRADNYLAKTERDAAASERSRWQGQSSGAGQQSDAFSRLMGAMDAELARLKGSSSAGTTQDRQHKTSSLSDAYKQSAAGERSSATPPSTSNGIADNKSLHMTPAYEHIGEDDDDEDMADLSAQDAELLEKMIHSGPPASLQALLEKESLGGNDTLGLSETERTVMHGMLESYKAQHGGAGPVSSMAGRMGLGRLPDDADARVAKQR